MNMTNHYEVAVLNAMRGVTLNAPTTMYVGLLSVLPTGNDLGSEVQYEGYKRQPITLSAPAVNDTEYGIGLIGSSNTTLITFPELVSNSGISVGAGIYDSATGGNMWAYFRHTDGLELNANEQPKISIGKAKLIGTGKVSSMFNAEILNVLRGSNINGFSTYLGLFNGDPLTTGTELVAPNYERVLINFTDPTQQLNQEATMTNSTNVEFNDPTTDWGVWTHIALFKEKTGGVPIFANNNVDANGNPITHIIKVSYQPILNENELTVGVN